MIIREYSSSLPNPSNDKFNDSADVLSASGNSSAWSQWLSDDEDLEHEHETPTITIQAPLQPSHGGNLAGDCFTPLSEATTPVSEVDLGSSLKEKICYGMVSLHSYCSTLIWNNNCL